MKNMWGIFTHDLRKAVSNMVGIIVVIGLVLIPGLFAWFNIAASWDPFANTKNITFAVANTDKGYKSDLIPLKVNVGSEVVSTLRANDQLDWVFTSKDEAIDGTKSGKYYAAVIIPETFSENMLTFFDPEAENTQLAYYTNEKKNALSPKITGQGAGEVSTQINEIFTSTISDVALNLAKSLSTYLDSDESKAALKNLDARITSLSDQLHRAAGSTGTYTSLLDSAESLVTTASGLADSATAPNTATKQSIDAALDSAGSVKETLDAASQSLADALGTSATQYGTVATEADDLLSSVSTTAQSSSQTLTDLATKVDTHIASYTKLRNDLQDVQDAWAPITGISLSSLLSALDSTITAQTTVRDALTTAASKITTAATTADSQRAAVSEAISQAQNSINSLKSQYSQGLKKDLTTLSGQISDTAGDAATIVRSLKQTVGDLSGSASSVTNGLDHAKDVVTDFSTQLDQAGTKLDTFHTGLSDALSSGDMTTLRTVLSSNPDSLASALSAPVALKREVVFPVATFGSAMAPLYIMIPLFVGTLLMGVTIRPEVSAATRKRFHGLSLNQEYLGHFGIFAVLALLQSSFLSLGALVFLRVQAVHPFLFLLATWCGSLVFTFLVYTLVVSFGNAGKAVGVFLLVVQISGAGGAYPLQMLPAFFQNISPFLPGTPLITMLRAAIAGVYANDYWIAMGHLALFIIPTLLLGLVLRRPLMSLNRRFVASVESTRLV